MCFKILSQLAAGGAAFIQLETPMTSVASTSIFSVGNGAFWVMKAAVSPDARSRDGEPLEGLGCRHEQISLTQPLAHSGEPRQMVGSEIHSPECCPPLHQTPLAFETPAKVLPVGSSHHSIIRSLQPAAASGMFKVTQIMRLHVSVPPVSWNCPAPIVSPGTCRRRQKPAHPFMAPPAHTVSRDGLGWCLFQPPCSPFPPPRRERSSPVNGLLFPSWFFHLLLLSC